LQLVRHHHRRELLEARIYFGKTPAQLSIGEIAFLTTLPRSPNRYDPLRDAKRATAARDRVLRQLRDRGAFTTAEIAQAMRQPLPTARRKAPFIAPHFCDYAAQQAGGRSVIRTTLDPRVQQLAEQQVQSRLSALRAWGVEQVAAVVIDNETREVLAMVGSAHFFEPQRQGQVNGAVARRSPGSTLKPFLYAAAFDDGTIVPESMLLDVPADYSGYVPENYDGSYRGRVSARDALIQSLNATAVRLLADEGVDRFVTLLRRGGLGSLDRDSARYGAKRLAQLAGERPRLRLGHPRQLHGDGRAAGDDAARAQIRAHRPRDRQRIHTRMLPEQPILRRQYRPHQRRRQLLEMDRNAYSFIARQDDAHHLAIAIEHHHRRCPV
jgi:membrane carboxypeptidase/penicillin-binding protein PbpC